MKKETVRPAKTGRPLALVDESQVITLAKINCTYEEIAAVVGCSTDTLKRRFADLIEKGREEGKASLRRIQFATALKGNATMQIWLGKQYLGQKDRQTQELSGLDGAPIAVNVTHRVIDPVAR